MKKTIMLTFTSILLLNCRDNKNISEQEKKQIISELNNIKILDQKYAGIPPADLKEKYGPRKAWEIFMKQRDSVALLNQGKIKSLYQKYGYLGYKQVGEIASGDFCIVIKHADNDLEFQQHMLEALKKEIEKGNADKANYAMLEDRVNVNLNKPQRFGSQVIYNGDGQAIPK
ncbi:DUF6624 domain-containing protein [Sediminicola arcticus]|jgi:hypothetical protein|uniref:DUF6624 domain-containing protein n=1 Tax=Sediminicola arcticus TaxID=1574308 RepID=A0ABV2SW69_9FLAO|tara:strand:- start:49 stop:564 length:516 start_codon:yes stop_codon:yes gene_type:complete